jgi:hypothetical protein
VKTKDKQFVVVRCRCRGELLSMEYDEVNSQYHVTIWKHGNLYPALSWMARLRFIWRLITTGKPHGDEVLLSQQAADMIGRFVNRDDRGE